MSDLDDAEERFWRYAEPLLAQPGVARSTMMGLPCLRINGAFFASWDRSSGDLLVKLPESDVDDLVAAGRAHAFAPAGRRFREWAAIASQRSRAWPGLLDRALTHVSQNPPKPAKRRRST